jgi:hypothetical protein
LDLTEGCFEQRQQELGVGVPVVGIIKCLIVVQLRTAGVLRALGAAAVSQ